MKRTHFTLLAGGAWIALALLAPQLWGDELKDGVAAQPEAPRAVATTDSAPPSTREQPSRPDASVRQILELLAGAEEVPEELRDPAFEHYVDLSLLGAAWGRLDAGVMADAALQFVEGERVLRRPHKAIRTHEVLVIALRVAAVKRDEAAFERLAAVAPQRDNAALTAHLAEARKLLASTPAVDPALTISVGDLSLSAFAFYKGCVQDIDAAIAAQDAAMLEEVTQHLAKVKTLPAEHRGKLEAKLAGARKTLPEGAKEALTAAGILDKLAATTRRNPFSGFPGTPTTPTVPQPPNTPPPSSPPPSSPPRWPQLPPWTWRPPTYTPPTSTPPTYTPPEQTPPTYSPPTQKFPPPQQQQQQWIPPSRPSKPGKYSPPGKGQSWDGGGYYPWPWGPEPGGEEESEDTTGYYGFGRRYGGW